MENHYVLISEAARELKLAPDTVRKMADCGELPVSRTSNGIRVFLSSDIHKLALKREKRRVQE